MGDINSLVEKTCVAAIEKFYKEGEIGFVDSLDENVIFYGPVIGMCLKGRQAVRDYLTDRLNRFDFTVDDFNARLIPLKGEASTIFTEFRLTVKRKDGRETEVYQHIIVDLKRKKNENGGYSWLCPFIHISNHVKLTPVTSTGVALKKRSSSVPISDKLVFCGEGGGNYYIPSKSIVYIEGGKNTSCIIHTEGKDYKVRHLLKDIEQNLPDCFYRHHASFIVNLNHIACVKNYRVFLDTGEELPIPQKKYAAVKAYIRQKTQSN